MKESQLTLIGDSKMEDGKFDPMRALNSGALKAELEGSQRGSSQQNKRQSVKTSITVANQGGVPRASVVVALSEDVFKQLKTERVLLVVLDKYIFLIPTKENGLKLYRSKGSSRIYRVKASISRQLGTKGLKETVLAPITSEFSFGYYDDGKEKIKSLVIGAEHLFTASF